MDRLSEDYKSGWNAGEVSGWNKAILETCNHDQACKNALTEGKRIALKEVSDNLHDIYVYNRFCKKDECQAKDNCVNCLVVAIKAMLERKMEDLNGQ